jgi:ABC-type nitrate/sulfonate/bicarbonate transport system substrate-binding protein
MKTKLYPALIMMFALLATLAGCSAPAATQPQTPAEDAPDSAETSEPFKLRVVTQAIFNEVTVADELGFFADEGIEIEYVGTLPQGVTEFQLMEQGEVDAFVAVHPPQVGQARVAGIKAVAVAPGSRDTREYPHIHYLVQNGSDIQTLDDLVGKKIGITGLAACTNGFVDFYLGGVYPDYTPDQVEYVVLGNNAEQSLLQGLVDVTTSHNPIAGKTLATGEVREIANSSDILQQEDFSLAARGFTEDFIAEHPEVVQGFVNAMYRARLWINAHLDDAIRLFADSFDIPPEDVSAAIYEENKNFVREDLQRWFDIAESVGNWQPGQITLDELYTDDFVPADAPASDADLRWEAK